MREICGLIFFIYISSIMFFSYLKEKDIFSPLMLFGFLTLLRYLPGITYLEQYSFISITEDTAFTVLIFESIAVFFTVFGYVLFQKRNKKLVSCQVNYTKKLSLNILGYLLFLIGFIAGVIYIYLLGGVDYIITNFRQIRSGGGLNYLTGIMQFMTIGMCIILSENGRKGITSVGVNIIAMYVLSSSFSAIFTRRSPILEAFMILVIVYHYCVKRIKISDFIKPKSIVITIVCIFFIVVMPLFRTSEGLSDFSLERFYTLGVSNINHIFDEFCYTGRDGFIYENYDFDKRWHGRNLINLALAPIPRLLYENKPPVDDGMYLANAAAGYFIKPPDRDLPWYNSWPMSTPGGLYINFGLLGVVFGSMLLGWLYGYGYDLLKKSNFDVTYVILYQLIIYQLEFTSLSIVQTLYPALSLFVAMSIFCGRRVVKKYKKFS